MASAVQPTPDAQSPPNVEPQRSAVLETVVRLGKDVTQVADLRSVLLRIYDAARGGLGFDRASIWLHDPDHKLFRGSFGTNDAGERTEEWGLSYEAPTWGGMLSNPEWMLHTRNYASETAAHPQTMQGVHEHAAVAMWAGGKPVGTLSVDNLLTQRPFTQEQLDGLRLFAGFAGLAVENARLLEAARAAEEHERTRRATMESVLRAAKDVTQVEDLRSTLLRVRKAVLDLGFDRAGIWLYDPARNLFHGTFGTSPQGELREAWDRVLDPSRWEPVLRDPDWFVQYADHAAVFPDGRYEMAGVRENAMAALWAGGKPVGLVSVDNLITQRPFTDAQLEGLRLFAGYAGEAIANVRLLEEVRESGKRFRDLAELLPQVVFEIDPAGRLTFVNQQALTLFGFTREELDAGLNALDVVAPADRERAAAAVRDVLNGQPTVGVEFTVCKKDGSIFSVAAYGNPIPKDGTVVGARGILVDLTERKQMEQRVRQMQKMDAIGQLAGGVAHDFNNQLLVILGYAEMLAKRVAAPDLRRSAERICAAAHRSADLTRKLLAFARKGQYEAVEVDVHKLIRETVEILEHTIDRRIRIQQSLKGRPVAVVGDSSQLQNALLNLGLNARDAMPDGGTLTFEAETVCLDASFCAAQPYEMAEGDYVLLAVRDTGCGMAEDVMKRLFEPFFTTKPVGKGTGMGLASVYGTVKHHKGAITVESEPGRGTCFRIHLPLASQRRVSEPVGAPPQPARAAVILVVDDEELVREVMADMLRGAGHEILLAANGREGVALYRERWHDIHLVVVDMIMPELNGHDTILALKKINPAVKVVVASGYTVGGDQDSLADDSIVGFVEKPVDAQELRAAVARALAK